MIDVLLDVFMFCTIRYMIRRWAWMVWCLIISLSILISVHSVYYIIIYIHYIYTYICTLQKHNKLPQPIMLQVLKLYQTSCFVPYPTSPVASTIQGVSSRSLWRGTGSSPPRWRWKQGRGRAGEPCRRKKLTGWVASIRNKTMEKKIYCTLRVN